MHGRFSIIGGAHARAAPLSLSLCPKHALLARYQPGSYLGINQTPASATSPVTISAQAPTHTLHVANRVIYPLCHCVPW